MRHVCRWLSMALVALVGGLVLVAAPPEASAQVGRRDGGLDVAGQALANPRGVLAITANAAALGMLDAWELRLQASLGGGVVDGYDGSGWGLYALLPRVGALRLAAAGEHLTTGTADGQLLGRLSFAAALPLGDRFAIGAATRLLGGAGPGGSSPWSQDLSMLARPWSWLSLAWRATGLGLSGVSDGAGLSTHYAWGLALRPIAGSDRLTLALDVDWPAGGTIGAVTASLATRLFSGLSLMIENRSVTHRVGAAKVQEQRTSLLVNVGLGFWGAELGLRGHNAVDGGEGAALQFGVRLSGDVPASFVDPGPRAVVIPLRGSLSEGPTGGLAFTRLVLGLDALARDPAVESVVLRFDDVKLSWAQVEELRAAIARLRGAGKQTASYAASLGTRGYMVAVATERVGMPSTGALSARGVGTDWIGLATALRKVGVQVEAIRFSEHKSATETFTRTELSETLRGTLQHIVARRYAHFLDAVALGRAVTTTVVEEALERGAVYPEDAKAAGLIDFVGTPEEFEDALRAWHLLQDGEQLAPYRIPRPRHARWGHRDRIAVVGLQGDIVDGEPSSFGGRSQIGGAETAKLLEGLSKRRDVRGVVVRVDSGGGAVYGSDVIYEAALRLSRDKPTATSMASVAASGGYWLALGSDRIFADASTITGSIGIWSAKPELSALWTKIGLGVTHVGAGPGSGATGIHRPWTPLEAAVLRRTLGRYYDLFLSRVSLRRKIERDTLLRSAGGRLFFGDEALERRLVDHQGGVVEAIADVRQRAGIAPGAPHELLLLPRLSLGVRLQLALGGGPGALLSALLGGLGDDDDGIYGADVGVAHDDGFHTAGAGGASSAVRAALHGTAGGEREAVLGALLRVAGPWLDRAALLTALPAGTPLAIAPIPIDTPAP